MGDRHAVQRTFGLAGGERAVRGFRGLQRIFGNDSTPVGRDAQRLIGWMSSDRRMIDVEGRLEEMNKWDIDMQVLSVPFHGALVQDKAAAGELQASLRTYLQHNARWESAAGELFVHRHTLRYRMRKVEELTGRDLGSSFDRMEFWLALRGRELIATPT